MRSQMTRIADTNDAEIIFNQNGVVGRQVLKQEGIEYVYLSFKPGCETAPHVQDVLMTFFIFNGQAVVVVENEEFELTEGQVIEIPAGKSRQWKNNGNEPLKLFVTKVLK